MLRVLLLATLTVMVAADTANINELTDELLTVLQEIVQEEDKDEISIPDIDKDWQEEWNFILIKGSFYCHGGKFRSLASVKRTGDVTLTSETENITLRVALGLETLDAKFGSCQAKLDHIGSMSSELEVSVESSSIDAQLSLTGNGDSCAISLDYIELELGTISIKTGSGLFHTIENRIFDIVVEHMHSKVVSLANSALAEAAQEALSGYDLCGNLPF